MNFFNIAVKNVRNKFGSYLAYLISTLFSVTVFHLFCTIYYNPTFQAFRFGTGKMSVLFKGIAIAVLLFASIFILYSNDYFVKTRKKEIAIYSVLGMKKTQIASMMFIETLIIGAIATICGIFLGRATAGYFTNLLMQFMGAGTNVTVVTDVRAIIVTVIAFTILFVISGIKSYNIIYEYQLIDLLSASKKGEALPEYSLGRGIISVVLIAGGYFISATLNVNVTGKELMLPTFLVVSLIAVGSYLFFQNFIPMLLTYIKKRKWIYYKTSNIISISQISYRAKGNAKMLCVISLLCAITVTMISASYSLYHGLEDMIEFYAPYSYLCKGITPEQQNQVIECINKVGEEKLVQEDKITLINAVMQDNSYLQNISDEEKAKSEQDSKEQRIPGINSECYIMSESMYQTIILHTNTKKGSLHNNRTDFTGGLQEGECYFIDKNSTSAQCSEMVDSILTASLNDVTKQFRVTGISLHKYIGLIDNQRKPTIVVNDAVYQQYVSNAKEGDIDSFYGYVFDDVMNSSKTVSAINEIVPNRTGVHRMPVNISYIEFYKMNFSVYGSYVFIGLFIGILFLLAVGSVLYYKLIIEAQEERPRYQVLLKTGMNHREILGSIMKQLGMVYGAPLVLGLINTVFALKTYNRITAIMGQETPTILNAALVVVIYVAAYGAFYLLSVANYDRIVRRK